jgi:hypothetical protein
MNRVLIPEIGDRLRSVVGGPVVTLDGATI